MSSRRQNTRSKTKNGSGRQGNTPIPHPPQIDTAICLRGHKFRFKASAALVNVQMQTSDFLQLLAVANTTTTASSLISAFRIRRVSIWGPPAADLIPVTVSLEYNQTSSAGSVGQRPRLFLDTSVGATEVACVSAKPPPQSAASMWQLYSTQASSGGAFILNGPVNSVVDVQMDFILQNGETVIANLATTAATVGRVYGGYLDGPPSTSLLVPEGLVPLP